MSFLIRKQTGFTLIEIMIVVAIIGILAAIAIPAFFEYRQKSYDTAAVSDLKNLEIYEQIFYGEYHQFVPIQIGDKTPDGNISKIVSINGQNILFTANVTAKMQIAANADALKQYLTIGAHHPSSQNIMAIELDQDDGIHYKPFQGNMQNSDIPNATSAQDLASWPLWK